jgi:hypothetical protein
VSSERLYSGSRETFAKVLVYESGGQLGLSHKYLEFVVNERKKSTIRDGVLVFSPKCELRLRFSRKASALVVRVTRSQVKRLKDVSQEEVESDGFKDRHELIAELRRYYPLITDDSVVTVVNFELVAPSGTTKTSETKRMGKRPSRSTKAIVATP